MLRLVARHADAWNAWFRWSGNRPDGLARLREQGDAACVEAGRSPATLTRMAAVFLE